MNTGVVTVENWLEEFTVDGFAPIKKDNFKCPGGLLLQTDVFGK